MSTQCNKFQELLAIIKYLHFPSRIDNYSYPWIASFSRSNTPIHWTENVKVVKIQNWMKNPEQLYDRQKLHTPKDVKSRIASYSYNLEMVTEITWEKLSKLSLQSHHWVPYRISLVFDWKSCHFYIMWQTPIDFILTVECFLCLRTYSPPLSYIIKYTMSQKKSIQRRFSQVYRRCLVLTSNKMKTN